MNSQFDKAAKEIFKLQKHCETIVRAAYKKEGLELSFPIDICMVAKYFGIEIKRENLNFGAHEEDNMYALAKLCFYLEKQSKNISKVIEVDNRGIGEIDYYSNYELFGIAREIGKYIVKQDKYDQVTQNNYRITNIYSFPYYFPPMLYASIDSLEYEMCAMFLLIPMELFLEEFSSYVELIKDSPILIDKWIPTLSNKSCIPYLQLVNGYNYFKICAYQYYQENLCETQNESAFMKKYGELLFR